MKINFKMKSLMVIAISVMIITISTIANAATEGGYSVGMTLTSDSKLKEGETVTINVKLTNINAGAGIDTIESELEYDTNVFEKLSTSSFTSNTNWTPSFAAQTNRLTAQKNEKVTAAETMFTITLKVKDSISVDSTKITLKDIVVSGGIVTNGGTGDIQVNNTSVTISKEKEAASTTETPTPTPTTPTQKPATNTAVKDTTTTTKTTLPKTGIVQYGTVAIVVVAIIGILSYVLYKKIAKDVK